MIVRDRLRVACDFDAIGFDAARDRSVRLSAGSKAGRSGAAGSTSTAGPAAGLRILFLALENNMGCERVLAAMAGHGGECAVMSPAGFYCTMTGASVRHFPLPRLHSIWFGALFARPRLEVAVREWAPHLVVPLDDAAAWLLRSLAVAPLISPALRTLLVRSLGSPETYAVATSRLALMEVAAAIGLQKPSHRAATTEADALSTAQAWGYPVVVKTEHSCGGEGIAIACDAKALRSQLASKQPRSLKRRLTLWLKRAAWRLAGFRGGSSDGVLLQSYVPGVPAFRTVATWNGRVLAGISFAAERIHPEPTGASTVVRLVENAEMDRAAIALTAALGCSGLVSYDFMLDEATGRAALIEMNPRCVGSCHLGQLFGHDVCGALAAEVSGAAWPAQPAIVPKSTMIALFPKELERDPDSLYLTSPDVLHDVPTHDHGLVDIYVKRLARLRPARAAEIRAFVGRAAGVPQSVA